MSTVITVENLGKKYLLSHQSQKQPYVALREVIADRATALGRGMLRPLSRLITPTPSPQPLVPASEDFWALNYVSFEIKKGDRVGIIGRNGAGKSTLLKILCRIVEPTTGRVKIKGRVASLLEVGTGFHPELTGRENIFLNGAILGMTRAEIKKKFDEIVDFAEIEKFLDTPVKRYSSGMYVRLAFAVAAHLEPEILVVDEVLAVGDAQFQKKCLGKMEDVSTKEGRTVLFVSHNMTAIRALCSKALILNAGQLHFQGDVENSISRYLQTESQQISYDRLWDTLDTAPGNDYVRMRRIRLIPLGNVNVEQLSVRTPFKIEIEYWNQRANLFLSFSMHLITKEEVIAFASTTWQEEKWNGKPFKAALYRSSCFVPGDLLNIGPYSLRLFFVEKGTRQVCKLDEIFSFELLDTTHGRGDWHGTWDGVVRPNLRWTTELVAE